MVINTGRGIPLPCGLGVFDVGAYLIDAQPIPVENQTRKL